MHLNRRLQLFLTAPSRQESCLLSVASRSRFTAQGHCTSILPMDRGHLSVKEARFLWSFSDFTKSNRARDGERQIQWALTPTVHVSGLAKVNLSLFAMIMGSVQEYLLSLLKVNLRPMAVFFEQM